MADDEVEEQMERRRRRTPPKKPCHREPSGEEAGPSKTQPPAPPVLKPRKPPVTFDKAIQTMRKLCPKSSRTPESAPSASVPSTSQAPPTAPDATSVDGGLAASSPSASGGGSAPRPSTLEVASSSTAASHKACELPKRPLDFKRVATGEDWSPQSTSTESPRTPLEVRQMLALRARQQQQSIPSPDDQSDNPSGIGDCSSGGAPEDSAVPDYTDDGWGFPKIGTPDCTWCIPELCECYRKICCKKEPKSKLVTTPVPGTSPTALLFVEPTKSALRGPPPPPDPDVIDVVPKVHFPDMTESDSTPPADPPKKSYKSDLVMFLRERHPNPPPRRPSIEYDLEEADVFFQPRRNVCDRGVNTVYSHVGYPFLVVHSPPSPTSPGKPAPQPPVAQEEKQQEQMEVGEMDPDAGRKETME